MFFTNVQDRSKAQSKLAGLLYLVIAVVGGFSIGYAPSVLVSEGDAAGTFQNLTEHYGLFQLAIVGDITVLVLEVLLTVLLFRLFKNFSLVGSTVASYTRMAMAIVMGMNLVNYMVIAIIASKPEYLQSFSQEQLASLSLLFFKVHKFGELAWQLFFAIHLAALSYVLLSWKKASKWMGFLLLAGSLGYAGDSLIQFTWLDSEVLTLVFSVLLVGAVVGELWFAIWLLVKGVPASPRS